jgi:chromosomal replication initiator protein
MIWEKTKEKLKGELTESAYALWIDPLECVQVKDNAVFLSSPDRYFSAYIAQHYLGLIEEKVRESGFSPGKIVLCEKEREPKSIAPSKGQMRLPNVPENTSKIRSLHPRYTFSEFMVGDSNILAQSACKSMTVSNDSVGPCLYINSGTGLGKSHLTHAVAHQILAESPMTRLHYVTAQQFATEMVRGIQSNTMDSFKRKYHEHCDILLVEDVHSLTGKKKTQEELNHILDSLIKSGKRVILTANSAPRDLVGIDEEFRSRMTAGLVASIKAPDISTRLRIVENKAMQHQLCLDEGQIDYLAQHIRGDVRKVESALIAIRARARLAGGEVDLDLVKEVVTNIIGYNQVLTAAMISDLVGNQFKVSVKDMQSRSRKKAITFPRQVAMYLCRKFTEESLSEIGRIFNRDHSTVLHSIKVVTTLTARDTSIGAQLDLLSDKVKQL